MASFIIVVSYERHQTRKQAYLATLHRLKGDFPAVANTQLSATVMLKAWVQETVQTDASAW
jgi:hypothetical protein